jgi:hypothetical protein
LAVRLATRLACITIHLRRHHRLIRFIIMRGPTNPLAEPQQAGPTAAHQIVKSLPLSFFNLSIVAAKLKLVAE